MRNRFGLLIRLLLFLAVLLFAFPWARFLLFGQQADIPPLEGVTNYGCTCTLLLNQVVRSGAWVDYDDAHLEQVRKNRFPLEVQKRFPHRGWARLVSQRSGKNADSKAAQDCVNWTRQMRQALEQFKKKENT